MADSTGRCNTLITAQAGGVLQMKYRTRTYYTDGQKALMWERWKQGWTLHQIAQLFDRGHTSVQKILSGTGGIPPPERHRSRVALTLAEREEISRAVAAGVDRFERLLHCSGERHPRSAARSSATVARSAIGRARPTRQPGIGHIVPSAANWREPERWPAS